jgi:NLR family CARD domain-containing protein 3
MVKLCCASDVSDQYEAGTLSFEQVEHKLNRYSTTLHAINSAIVKLSKLTYAGTVYRGVSGLALPPEFWVANEFGVKGGIDGAFMSTTSHREVALSYAASGGKGIVFEIQQGMIDRGADISFLSQYPHEKET